MRRALAVGALTPLALLTLSSLAPACSRTEDPPGVLMLAVETDMSAGRDKTVQAVGLYVRDLDRSRTLFQLTEPVAPDGTVHFPATLAVIGRNNPGASIRIRVVGFRNGEAHVMRDAVTTIPTDRTALLRLPLRWVNYEKATGKIPQGGNTTPAVHTLAGDEALEDPFGTLTYTECKGETTTVDGACVPWTIESATLPDFVETNVFGGGTVAGGGTCFDTEKCFATDVQVLPLDATCVLPKPSGTFTLAVKQPVGASGACVGDGCFIPLDPESPEGWTTDLGNIRLSPGTCKRVLDSNGKNQIVATTSCGSKPADAPLCGEASAVGPGTDLPVTIDLDAGFDAPETPSDSTMADVLEVPFDLASGVSPTQILSDLTNVYYVTKGCSVMRAAKNQNPGSEVAFGFPLDSGAPTDLKCKIARTPSSDKLVLSKVGSSDIEVFALPGGAQVVPKPSPQENVISVSVSQTTLGWVSASGIKYCGLGTCTGGAFGGSASAAAFITLDHFSPKAFVTTNYTSNQVIAADTPSDAGLSTLLTLTSGPVGPLAFDANNVYWTVQTAAGGIYGTSKSIPAGNPIPIVDSENLQVTDNQIPHEITVENGFVFWTNSNDQVRGAPVGANATAKAITLAINQNQPRGITVDANFVYWTSMGDNKVRRITRPKELKP